ncbi:MAG: DeoR/GlpR family DNA-binding transcription regulator [Planctomycetaceae bacterium]|nr:DeoR/GlpR family DNA-binding transcription regulator [Planctomycetaceae bacterium]
MHQEERIFQILQALKVSTTLSNQDIMSMFNISRDTARRDIVKLVEEGVAVRTHGGITLPTLMTEIQSYRNRISQNIEVKRLIAQRAALYLADHKLGFLDVSTTVEELCEYIPDAMNVFTHSINNAERLMDKACDVNLLGGRLNRKNRFFHGGVTLAQMDDVCFDIVVLGAAAVHVDGLYYEESEDAEVKRKAVERASHVLLVVDDGKFLKTSRFRGAEFADIDVIVTNRMPPETVLGNIREAGCKLDVLEERR